MPTFIKKTTETKTKSISVSKAEFTAMQERATAFIFKQVFENNVTFNSAEDIIKHKTTQAKFKEIFKKGNEQLFTYPPFKTPIDKKSLQWEWLESFYQQQKKMLSEYSSPEWKVFNRDGGFMKFISDLVKEKFGISQKDTWNPADIWLIQKPMVFRKVISKALEGDSATQTLAELNVVMRKLFNDHLVVGVSLKKISGKTAQYQEINADEPFFKKLEKRVGEYSYNYLKANIKLGWDERKKQFETKNDGNFWVSDNEGKVLYKFQLKANQSSSFSNLKFEPNAIGGAAFLGKAPLDLVEKLVVGSKGVNSLLFNSTSRTHNYYPKTFEAFKAKSELKKWTNMFKAVRQKGVDTGDCKTEKDFIVNMGKGFTQQKPYPFDATCKLMVLHFLYYLTEPTKKKVINNLVTDIILLSAKMGRKQFEFGPFGKLF